MSPTMYASGARIFMVTDILFIVIIALMNLDIIKNKLHKKIALYIILILWIVVAIIRWMYWAFIY